MATTFTWSINNIEVYPEIQNLQNFVAMVEWQLTGNDGTNTSFTKATFGYKPEDVSGFTPYEQLTEQQVLGWVQSRLGENGISHFQGIVQIQLDNMNLQPIFPEPKPLPWSSQE